MRRFEAAIFDLDGTLVESESLHLLVTQRMLAHRGHTLTPAEFSTYVGNTTRDMWIDLVERFGLPGAVDRYLAEYDTAYLAAVPDGVQDAPGAIALVRTLSASGVPLGIVSSSLRSWIVAILGAIGLAREFGVIVSAEDVQRSKPAPDGYLLAARRLGVPPERCLVFEDSGAGIASARAAGTFVVAVRSPHVPLATAQAADVVVDSLAQVDLSRLGVVAPRAGGGRS